MTAIRGAGLERLGLDGRALAGKPLGEMLAPGSAGLPVMDAHRRALEGSRESCELDWRERTFQCDVDPLRSPEGEVVGVIGIALDVTERKRETEDRFRQMAETIDDVFWMTTLDRNRIIYVSPAYERIWGRTCASLYDQPRSWVEAVHPEDRDRIAESPRFSRPAEGWEEEYRILRETDGETRWILDRAFPVRDPSGTVYRLAGVAEDITERKRAEERLWRNRAFLDSIVENIPDMIFVKDAEDGRFLRINRAGEELIGRSREEMLGKTDHDFFPAEEADFFRRTDAEVLASGTLQDVPEEPIHTAEGTRFLHTKKIPILDDEGRPQYLLGISADITARKRAEERLHLYREIIANSAEAIAIISPEGIYQEQNDAHASLLGYTDEELSTATPAIHLGDETFGVIRSALARTGQFRGEVRSRTKAGRSLELELSAFAVCDDAGDPICFVGVKRNITKRKQAEQALVESEERTRAIVDTVLDGIVTIDSEGTITTFNAAAARMFGYEPGEVIGQSIRALLPPSVDHRFDRLFRWYKTRGIGRVDEGIGRKKDGTFFPLELAVSESELATGLLYTGVVRDITDRKRAEAALISASRMEATSTLAGGIAHDFNNLMAVVLTNTELLRSAVGDRAEQRELVDGIATLARRAGDLAEQMLTFARGGKTEPIVLDLNAIVRDTIELHASRIPEDVAVTCDFASDLRPIEADATQMRQAAMNLLINGLEAIEATAQPGRIRVSTRNVVLDGAATHARPGLRPGNHVLLSVEDSGSGMDAETQARVFEPFFTTKFQGRGLGLAAVYGIVKNHGGHITVRSEEGQGAIFEIVLPATEASTPGDGLG